MSIKLKYLRDKINASNVNIDKITSYVDKECASRDVIFNEAKKYNDPEYLARAEQANNKAYDGCLMVEQALKEHKALIDEFNLLLEQQAFAKHRLSS